MKKLAVCCNMLLGCCSCYDSLLFSSVMRQTSLDADSTPAALTPPTTSKGFANCPKTKPAMWQLTSIDKVSSQVLTSPQMISHSDLGLKGNQCGTFQISQSWELRGCWLRQLPQLPRLSGRVTDFTGSSYSTELGKLRWKLSWKLSRHPNLLRH